MSQPPPRIATLVSLSAGESLCGRYRLERTLGEGGMGVVWLATDLQLDRQVAVKVLPTALSRDRRSIDRLRAEAVRSLDLTHEHIVRLYTFDQDAARGESAFLVMQYVSGRTLHELLADHTGGLPLERVRVWAGQVARAIDHAHAKGILHRDIKPSNIIIESGTDTAFLMDFGIAREAKETMTLLTGRDSSGTLPYMSPQQLMGENHPSNDIYSLSATLYEALCGHVPFRDGHVQTQIVHKPAPLIEGLPDSVNETLLAGLSKSAQDRPCTATELAGRLSLSVAIDPQGRRRSARALKRRIPMAAGAAAALIVVACVVGIAAMYVPSLDPTRGSDRSHGPAGAIEGVPPSSADGGGASPDRAAPAPGFRSDGPAPAAELARARLAAERARASVPAVPSVIWSNVLDGVESEAARLVVAQTAFEAGRYREAEETWDRASAMLDSLLERHEVARRQCELERARIGALPEPLYISLVAEAAQQEREINDAEGLRKNGYFSEAEAEFTRLCSVRSDLLARHREAIARSESARRSIPERPSGPLWDAERAEARRLEIAIGSAHEQHGAGDFDQSARAFEAAGTAMAAVVSRHTAARNEAASSRARAEESFRAIDGIGDTGGVVPDGDQREQASLLLVSARGAFDEGRFVEARGLYEEACRLQDQWMDALRELLLQALRTSTTKANAAVSRSRVAALQRGWPGDAEVQVVAEQVDSALAPLHGERRSVDLGGGVLIEFVYIDPRVAAPDGFRMGSATTEPHRQRGSRLDETEHIVRLTRPYWIQSTELTQAQWARVSESRDSSPVRGGEFPVTNVTWPAAATFCGELARFGIAARLPTEAEWEFACRAGTTTPYHYGSTADSSRAAFRVRPVPVAQFRPNAWGLYDMHGSVEEWCADWYGEYPSGTVLDPAGPVTGTERVLRGGSWQGDEGDTRSAERGRLRPSQRASELGFRACADRLPD